MEGNWQGNMFSIISSKELLIRIMTDNNYSQRKDDLNETMKDFLTMGISS